jgi:hypothetical protein
MTAELLTDTPTRRGPRRRLRRVAAPALVLALVGGAAACAEDAGDDVTQTKVDGGGSDSGNNSNFSATAAYLSTVAESSAAEPYRVSMDFSIDAAVEHVNADDMMTGEIDGDQASFHLDMSSLFDQIPGAGNFDASQMTMDMVTDGNLLYIKAPMFAALGAMTGGGDAGPYAGLAAIADQWGSVDPAALGGGADIGEVVGQAGAQAGDPRAFLDLVSEATDPHELGDDTIDNTPVQGLGATITFQEMLEAQGRDVDEYMNQVTAGEGLPDAVVDELLQTEVPVEVWVDGDNLVRRVKLDVDMTSLIASAGVEDSEMGSAAFTITMDFSDYGADDIAIEVPESAVDITDAYAALMNAGG